MSNVNTASGHQSEKFEKGLAIRRQVLGDEYVDAALNRPGELVAQFQQLVTENCWGTVWTRDQLDRKTRSLLTVAITGALNRQHELRVHTLGALRNGCTPEEIVEVMMHLAVYAGMPAGVDGFNSALAVIQEFSGTADSAATG